MEDGDPSVEAIVAEAMEDFRVLGVEISPEDEAKIQQIIEAIKRATDPEERRNMMGEYQQIIERTADAAGKTPEMQIRGNVTNARVKFQMGGREAAIETLDYAVDYADGMTMTDLGNAIHALRKKIRSITPKQS